MVRRFAGLALFLADALGRQYVGEEVKTVVAYSVEELDVVHILIVRHYGCGGVQAAIASSPEESADEPGMARVQVRLSYLSLFRLSPSPLPITGIHPTYS